MINRDRMFGKYILAVSLTEILGDSVPEMIFATIVGQGARRVFTHGELGGEGDNEKKSGMKS